MKKNSLTNCLIVVLFYSLTSCFSDTKEGKTKNFYTYSHKAADVIRIPIIEPFELTNPDKESNQYSFYPSYYELKDLKELLKGFI